MALRRGQDPDPSAPKALPEGDETLATTICRQQATGPARLDLFLRCSGTSSWRGWAVLVCRDTKGSTPLLHWGCAAGHGGLAAKSLKNLAEMALLWRTDSGLIVFKKQILS